MAPPAAAGLHTRRGLRWMSVALGGFLVALVGTAGVLLLLAPEVFVASSNSPAATSLDGALATLSLVYAALNIGISVAFVIGFTDLHSGAEEHGSDHVRAVGQAAIFLFVAFLLFLSTLLMPSVTWPQLAVPWIHTLPPWATLVAGIALPGFRAIFCGLVLLYTVSELTEEIVRVRLLLAMSLGVVGAVVWPGALVYSSIAAGSADARLIEFVVAVVVGAGISALSLAMVLAAYLRTARILEGAEALRHSAAG